MAKCSCPDLELNPALLLGVTLASCTTALQAESWDLQRVGFDEQPWCWWWVREDDLPLYWMMNMQRVLAMPWSILNLEGLGVLCQLGGLCYTSKWCENITPDVSISGPPFWKWVSHYCKGFLSHLWQYFLLSQGLVCPVLIIIDVMWRHCSQSFMLLLLQKACC